MAPLKTNQHQHDYAVQGGDLLKLISTVKGHWPSAVVHIRKASGPRDRGRMATFDKPHNVIEIYRDEECSKKRPDAQEDGFIRVYLKRDNSGWLVRMPAKRGSISAKLRKVTGKWSCGK